MLYLETPFVSRAGVYLEGFTHKKQYLWNCSCPICGDISKGRKKKRFFIYNPPNSNELNVKCHHCGYSTTFISFLKIKFPELYKEYLLEKFKDSKPNEGTVEPKVEQKKHKFVKTKDVIPCSELPSTHKAIEYLKSRQIPESKYHLFLYCAKIKAFTNSLIEGKFPEPIKDDHDRLIIPFYNTKREIVAFQARAFEEKYQPKYYSIKLNADEKIYGIERVDTSKTIYVVEGPIDSLFLDNAVAVAGSHFDIQFTRQHKQNVVLVFDNEPRNKEICKQIQRHIMLGYKVCLLPHSVKEKDINEQILSGKTKEQIMHCIDSNTYEGAEALLRFSLWKQTTL